MCIIIFVLKVIQLDLCSLPCFYIVPYSFFELLPHGLCCLNITTHHIILSLSKALCKRKVNCDSDGNMLIQTSMQNSLSQFSIKPSLKLSKSKSSRTFHIDFQLFLTTSTALFSVSQKRQTNPSNE